MYWKTQHQLFIVFFVANYIPDYLIQIILSANRSALSVWNFTRLDLWCMRNPSHNPSGLHSMLNACKYLCWKSDLLLNVLKCCFAKVSGPKILDNQNLNIENTSNWGATFFCSLSDRILLARNINVIQPS